MTLLFIFFSSYALATFSLPYLIRYFIKIGLVDKPGKRRIHTSFIPRMGGIIIFPIILIFVWTYQPDLNSIKFLLLSLTIIMICGVIDDIVGLSWRIKFLLQGIAVIFLMIHINESYEKVFFLFFEIQKYYSYPLLFIFILGTINSFNLIDGLDGLVSGYALIVLIPVFLVSINNELFFISVISICLIGILLGLLKYNSFPALIFLGDTGSLLVGHLLLFIILTTTIEINHNKILDMNLPIILLGLPILDTLRVMYERILRGSSAFLPGKDHIHHLILGKNVRHKTTVFILHGFAILFIINSLLYIQGHKASSIILFLFLMILLFSTKYILAQLRGSKKIRNIYEIVIKKPVNLILKLRKYLFAVSAFLFAIILMLKFPAKISITSNYYLFFIIGGVGLLFLSIQKKRKDNAIAPIYFLFNLIFLFSINSNSLISTQEINIGFIGWKIDLITLTFSIFLGILALVLFARDKLFPTNTIFLTGLDLTIFSILILLLFLRELSPIDIKNIFSNVFIAVSMHFWFKLFIYHYKKLGQFIYFFLFALIFSYLIFGMFSVYGQ